MSGLLGEITQNRPSKNFLCRAENNKQVNFQTFTQTEQFNQQYTLESNYLIG